MDREAWWATVHGVSKSKTPLQLTLHGFVNIFDLFNVKEESEKVGLKLDIQKTKIMASGPITSWEIDGEQCQTLFWGAPKSLQMVTAAMKLKDAYSLEEQL